MSIENRVEKLEKVTGSGKRMHPALRALFIDKCGLTEEQVDDMPPFQCPEDAILYAHKAEKGERD